jgi:soluble lytic murein transglycosylase
MSRPECHRTKIYFAENHMKYPKRLRSFVVFAALFTCIAGAAHFAYAFSSNKPKVTAALPQFTDRKPDSKTEQWLSTINREGMMGIDSEPEERQTWLRARAREFSEFIRKPASHRAETDASKCDAKDPFCTWMSDPEAAEQITGRRSRKSSNKGNRGNWKLTSKWFEAADLEKLKSLSERQLNFAVRRFKSFDPLEKVSDVLLEKKSCDLAPISFLVATKAEEYFPEEKYREKATKLYEIAANCGDTEVKARAQYRYSLLQIWAGHCDVALPHLNALSQPGQGHEFRPRAMFWTVNCGLQAGTSEGKAMAEKTKETLFANYPFSLHSLLLQKDQPARVKSFLAVPDTVARFRSVDKPELNSPVLAAEALIAAGESGWAKKILASINLQADAAEPEFQVYLASLYSRVNDPISKFRTLTVAFRDHPSTISRASLALYYPKNNELSMDVIRAAGVNELVVMSLIRQESAFNEKARSPAGALGLMQVMPRTARLVERTRHRPNLYDPNNNVRIGSKYFSTLLKRYDGDTELALAAYNAGPERVEAWVKRYNVTRRTLFLDLIPFKETRDYVASIARNYFWYSVLYSDQNPVQSEVADKSAPQSANQSELTTFELSRGIVSVFKTFGT